MACTLAFIQIASEIRYAASAGKYHVLQHAFQIGPKAPGLAHIVDVMLVSGQHAGFVAHAGGPLPS